MSILGDVFGKSEKKPPEASGKARETQQKVEQMANRIGDLEKKTEAQIQKADRAAAQHLRKVESAVQPLSGEIGQLKKEFRPISEKMESLGEQVQLISRKLEELREQLQPAVCHGEKPDESLQAMEEKLEEIRKNMGDKIHEENVKCYRNLKSLLVEFEENLQDQLSTSGQTDDLRRAVKRWKGIAVFSVIDFILLVFYILYSMGLLDRILPTLL